MKLLNFVDFEVKINPEALLVKPIRLLYNKDRSVNKEKFMQQISYMYFMVDPRSTYNYIVDEEEKAKTIIEQEGLNKDFKPDSLLKEAMKIYKKHTITASSLMLHDTLIAADKIREFLKTVDLTERDDNGKPVFTVQQITSAMKNIMDIIPQLKELEKKVDEDIQDKTKARGSDKGLFEDGFDF